MTRPAVFTQGDISKLLKGAKAAGVTVSRIEIDPSGKIVAQFDDQRDYRPLTNEWDAIYRDTPNRAAR